MINNVHTKWKQIDFITGMLNFNTYVKTFVRFLQNVNKMYV